MNFVKILGRGTSILGLIYRLNTGNTGGHISMLTGKNQQAVPKEMALEKTSLLRSESAISVLFILF